MKVVRVRVIITEQDEAGLIKDRILLDKTSLTGFVDQWKVSFSRPLVPKYEGQAQSAFVQTGPEKFTFEFEDHTNIGRTLVKAD